MKFAQKTEQKQQNCISKIKTEKKHFFVANWQPTARQRPVRQFLSAARWVGPALCGHTARCWPSD
jgi:hypothetical protein